MLFHFGPSLIHAPEFHSLWPKHGAFADSTLYKSLHWVFSPRPRCVCTGSGGNLLLVIYFWVWLFDYRLSACTFLWLHGEGRAPLFLKPNGTHLEPNIQMLKSCALATSGCCINVSVELSKGFTASLEVALWWKILANGFCSSVPLSAIATTNYSIPWIPF